MPTTTFDDLITVGATGIRQRLLADENLVTRLPDIEQRVGLQDVDANTPMPYVLMTFMWGTNENSTQRKAFDAYWQVDVISSNQAEAGELFSYVKAALEWQRLPYPEPWYDYAMCTYSGAALTKVEIQGFEYFGIGGTFRLRAAETF